MYRCRRLAVAIPLLATAVAAVATGPAGATTVPPTPPASTLPGDPAPAQGTDSDIAADFVQLIDDTGALSVAVPPAWVDVDTTPGTNDDGTTMPWISASTDFGAYRETFDVSGMVFLGVTYTTDLQSWIDRLGQPDGCQTKSTDAYDDGAFQGLAATFDGCGTTGEATFLLIAANVADDETRTYVLQVQTATPADAAFVSPILASFNAVGITSTAGAEGDVVTQPGASIPDATTPAVTVTLPDGSPLVPATAPASGVPTGSEVDDAFTPSNAIAEGAVQITDDTRTITVAVPPDWAEVATVPSLNDSGDPLPQIVASPDLAGFVPTDGTTPEFGTAGVRFVARPFDADTAAAVSAAASTLPCTPGSVRAYTDPVFTGHILQLSDCGGTATRIYLVAASPSDQSMTASLLVQVTDADDSDLETVLSSFNVDPSAPEPGSGPAVSTEAAPTPVVTTASG